MITEEQKDLALREDMFEGDFGEFSDKILSNKIVLGLVTVPCSHCGLLTKTKTHHRVTVALFDGELCRYRYCESCCKAMAASVRIGEPEILERRLELAERRKKRSMQTAGCVSGVRCDAG